jgi:hypothetical protein
MVDAGRQLFSVDRWPLPSRAHQRKYPHGITFKFVDQAIVFVRNPLARTGNLSDATNLRKVGQVMRGVAKRGIHGHCSLFVVLGNIVEDILAILFRFGCPAEFHSSVFLIN